MKVDPDVDLRQITADTELFTGAELEVLCKEAGIVALREDISATLVCSRHFQTVRNSLKPAYKRGYQFVFLIHEKSLIEVFCSI